MLKKQNMQAVTVPEERLADFLAVNRPAMKFPNFCMPSRCFSVDACSNVYRSVMHTFAHATCQVRGMQQSLPHTGICLKQILSTSMCSLRLGTANVHCCYTRTTADVAVIWRFHDSMVQSTRTHMQKQANAGKMRHQTNALREPQLGHPAWMPCLLLQVPVAFHRHGLLEG